MNTDKTATTSLNRPMNPAERSGADERQPYEPPELEVSSVRVVTLGGTPGADDTGAEFTQDPLGGSSPSSEEEEEGPFG